MVFEMLLICKIKHDKLVKEPVERYNQMCQEGFLLL